jgi:hypothetical protein
MNRRRTPGHYVRGFFTNWRESDDPLARKVWLTLRNRATGTVTLRFCCGHHGEPGC